MDYEHRVETLRTSNDEMIGLRVTRIYSNGAEVIMVQSVISDEVAKNIVHGLCLTLGVESPIH